MSMIYYVAFTFMTLAALLGRRQPDPFLEAYRWYLMAVGIMFLVLPWCWRALAVVGMTILLATPALAQDLPMTRVPVFDALVPSVAPQPPTRAPSRTP